MPAPPSCWPGPGTGPGSPAFCCGRPTATPARGALRSAADLLDRAAATGERTAEVAAARVRVRTATGRPADALAAGLPELVRAAGAAHAELCLALADAAVAAGEWDTATSLLARSGRSADPRALGLGAEAAYGAGCLEMAARLASRAVAAAGDARTITGSELRGDRGPLPGAADPRPAARCSPPSRRTRARTSRAPRNWPPSTATRGCG